MLMTLAKSDTANDFEYFTNALTCYKWCYNR